MLEITSENALKFLQERGWVKAGPIRIEPLSWGVSNAVFRVVTPSGLFVLKQSRPRLRTEAPWFSDLNRVYREQEVMELLHPLLPPLVVPEVLFSDRKHYVFAMNHAPREAVVWKETLLAGHVDLALGERTGEILGTIHETTARMADCLKRFEDRTVFIQLRVDPFYRRIQERHPEVAAPVEDLVRAMVSSNDALCHGDYSPKNILVHDSRFTLVDYETAHLGDPTMDLGFFLSHLLLKALKAGPHRHSFFELTRAFWKGYGAVVRFQPLSRLQARGLGHLAVCLLARIDGTSPVDYLSEESQRESIRRVGQRLLQERLSSWEEVVRLCDEEWQNLADKGGPR